MALREAFAANLSRHCEREPSIAAVCRATRINRQQFNRYLSGDALPNGRNLAKICRYFNIEEADLFSFDRPGCQTLPDHERSAALDIELRAAIRRIRVQERTSIDPGLYFAHFAIPEEPHSIMRSAVIVRDEGNFTTFRRLTSISEPKGSWWGNFQGDHSGVILERVHWLYFIGLNKRGHEEPSLLVLRWIPMSRPMLGGQAMVTTPSGPTVTAVVLSRCAPRTSLRRAIKASHVYSVDDPMIEPMVIDMLDQHCQTLEAMTRHLDLSVRALNKPRTRSVLPAGSDT